MHVNIWVKWYYGPICKELGVRDESATTSTFILSGFSAEGKLIKYREGRHWAYKLAVDAG